MGILSLEYEFDDEQNKIFRKFVRNLRLISIVLILAGIVTLIDVSINTPNILLIFNGITWILMGILFYLPIRNFLRITTTEGFDIKELISALSILDKGWIIVLIALTINKIAQLIYIFVG